MCNMGSPGCCHQAAVLIIPLQPALDELGQKKLSNVVGAPRSQSFFACALDIGQLSSVLHPVASKAVTSHSLAAIGHCIWDKSP